jgi:hypothetical protein
VGFIQNHIETRMVRKLAISAQPVDSRHLVQCKELIPLIYQQRCHQSSQEIMACLNIDSYLNIDETVIDTVSRVSGKYVVSDNLINMVHIL